MPTTEIPSSRLLELVAKSVFACGLGGHLVESRWEGTRDAFDAFDPQRIAAYGDGDVAALSEDPRIIRNARKIRAVVENARRLAVLESEAGSVEKWLEALGDDESVVADLRERFVFVGDIGARHVLAGLREGAGLHESG